MKTTTIKIREGKTFVEVKAYLTKFPKKYIIEGVNAQNKFRKGSNDKVEDYEGLQICRYKKMYWIYYADKGKTGHFDSKEKCISWFTNAGR